MTTNTPEIDEALFEEQEEEQGCFSFISAARIIITFSCAACHVTFKLMDFKKYFGYISK